MFPKMAIPIRPLSIFRTHHRRKLPPSITITSQRTCSCHATTTAVPPKPPADHRELGIQQELFTTSIYSPGSPLLLPNGTRIFNRLVEFLRRQYVRYGFEEVITPTIYKKALWQQSGHLENYREDMFTVSALATPADNGGAHQKIGSEEDGYGLKPMNCPGHCLIFASKRRTHKDLPVRYADFSPLHRNEISGALSGLTRVRRFHQDDGHIFCRPIQVEEEIRKTLDFVRLVYSTFKLGPYRLALSTRPADNYIGSLQEWESAEDALRRALDASGLEWTVNEGDGAFYGPKIDIILRDSDGKEHQTATIQLDFQLPRRFDLSYTAPAPELERRGESIENVTGNNTLGPVTPVMIHRAVLGSVERLMALLIEHYDGKWPFWLNPRQIMILTTKDSEPVVDVAQSLQNLLSGNNVSTDVPITDSYRFSVGLDDKARTLASKIKLAKQQGYSVVVVVGERSVASGNVTVDVSALESKRGSEKPRQIDMSPKELLGLLRNKADSYS